MKTLNLNAILGSIDTGKITETEIKIKKIAVNIQEVDNDTVIFALNRIQKINKNKLDNLKNCYIITDQPLLKEMQDLREHFIFVLDIDEAYKKFIRYYRSLFTLPVIAVTGTCGKTTTKEIIKQALEKKYRVVGTYLSKNALRFDHDYLMAIDETTDYAVFETAITEPGHLIYNCNFFRPTIGVITNVGIDHLNECKTIDNYIRTKGEMLAGLQYKGTLIINRDDENTLKIDFTPFKGKIRTFGIKHKADFYARNIKTTKNGMSFTLHRRNKEYEALIPGIGVHNVYNALAAITVLDTLGFAVEETIAALKDFKPVEAHLALYKGYNGSIIVDDTWSSNPTSVRAAFESLKDTPNAKTAVLGNIAYLGEHEDEACEEIGRMLVEYNYDYLVTKDNFSKRIGSYAIKYGMSPNKIFNCTDTDEVRLVLENLIEPDMIILFKISMLDKSMGNIVKHFIKE